jgi:hypothetical protein
MLHDRMKLAIGRIELGLAQLERHTPSPIGHPSDPTLQIRHDRLKAEARSAISDIDRLLGTLES